MINLSVCIPMFRSKYIAWLALESMCRQKDIDFEWELIVAEEIFDEAFGEEEVMKYVKRLEDIGCSRIEYIALKKWIPLSKKYKLLADKCSDSSKIFASCATDLFAPPKRLKVQHDIFTNDQDLCWHTNGKTIMYDILSEKVYLSDLFGDCIISDGSNRAVRMDIMKNLPSDRCKVSVDGWLLKSAKNYICGEKKEFKTLLDDSDNWKYGLNTHGLNNISQRRERYFHNIKARTCRIKDVPFDINETIPEDIMDRLRDAKKFLKLHKRGLPK